MSKALRVMTMSKPAAVFLLAVAALAPAAPALAAIGPEAAACRSGSGKSAVRVRIDGFKRRVGDIQLRLYGGDPRRFLVKGGRLKRLEIPVTRSGAFEVCVAVPGPGRYAIAVHHDLEGDGDQGWNDGGGFSNNPRVSVFDFKPDYRQVAFTVGPDLGLVRITLLYRRGLKIAPVAARGG